MRADRTPRVRELANGAARISRRSRSAERSGGRERLRQWITSSKARIMRGPFRCGACTASVYFRNRGRMDLKRLVACVAENGAVLLSPLFAGRGWVRGLGVWPLRFRLFQTYRITRTYSGAAHGFNGAATHPRPSPDLSPQEAGRGDFPSFSMTRSASAREARHGRNPAPISVYSNFGRDKIAPIVGERRCKSPRTSISKAPAKPR